MGITHFLLEAQGSKRILEGFESKKVSRNEPNPTNTRKQRVLARQNRDDFYSFWGGLAGEKKLFSIAQELRK